MKNSTTAKLVKLPESQKQAPKDAKVVGKLDPDERIEVTVRVQRRATPGAAVHAAALAGEYLSREEFRDKYGADPADLEKIENYAQEHGLDVVQSSVAQRSVRLSGTLSQMEAAFRPNLKRYKSGDLTFRGRSGSVSVPKNLESIIEGVMGLDNRPVARPHFQIARKKTARAAGPTAAGDGAKSLTAVEVAALYNFPKLTGAGQCIAIIELGGGFRTKDIRAYFKALKLPTPTVSAVSVAGGHNEPDGPTADANGEVMLDIEVAGAVAPKSRIAVYFAPNTDDGFVGAVSAAVHDTLRKPSVISISWGGPESNWTQQAITNFDAACSDAALLGITICCSAGDQGSSDLRPPSKRANADFPASSPNVLACGGTRLIGAAAGIKSETVWNDGAGSGTGGGVSEVFPVPAYQKKVKVPKSVNPGGKVGRGVPDISGNADPATGFEILVDGAAEVVGGTSAVSPLWAGLIALLNQGLGKSVGFLTPRLYKLGASSNAFRDITVGNNATGGGTGYKAGAGWDACTGLGSPHGANLLASLK